MTNRTEQTGRRRRAPRIIIFAAFALLAVCRPEETSAQWVTSGNNTTTANNVGVGTTTPSQMFHVHSVGTWAGTRVTTAATGGTINDGVHFGYDDAYGAYVWNRETSPVIFATSNTERMRIDAAGSVVISTPTAGRKLGVTGGADTSVAIGDRGMGGSVGLQFLGTGYKHGAIRFDGDSLVVENASNTVLPSTWYNGQPMNLLVRNGSVGIGTTAPAAKLHVAGDIRVDGNISAKYQDVAEWVPTREKLAAGTVVVLDIAHNNHVAASAVAYDMRVAGVVSAQPGLTLGEAGEGKALIATTGRVRVRVDATRAPIRVGDLLVTGEAAGVAMRSRPLDLGGVPIHRPGTIIGKALEPLDKGTGEILVLLSLQ